MARPEPNPAREPGVFGRIYFNGRDFGHLLVEFPDGIEIEDEWNVQRPVGSNGAVAVFKGTKIAEAITFKFETGENPTDYDDIWDLWDMFAPSPTNPGGGATTTTTGSTYAIGSPAASATPAGGAATPTGGFSVPSGSGKAGSTTDSDGFPNNKSAGNVGPRPPTVVVEFEIMKRVGILAVARKKWKGPVNTETNSWRLELTVIQSKPPTPAGVGQQTAPKGNQFTQGATKSQVDTPSPLGGAAAAV